MHHKSCLPLMAAEQHHQWLPLTDMERRLLELLHKWIRPPSPQSSDLLAASARPSAGQRSTRCGASASHRVFIFAHPHGLKCSSTYVQASCDLSEDAEGAVLLEAESGQTFPPEAISAYVVKHLLAQAARGLDASISKAVISVSLAMIAW